MSLNEAVERLTEKVASLDYVQDFRQTELKLKAQPEIWQAYELMKTKQKEAVMYQQVCLDAAFRQASLEAQQLEKQLKKLAIVENYAGKMADVSDLLAYLTAEIEEKVNESA